MSDCKSSKEETYTSSLLKVLIVTKALYRVSQVLSVSVHVVGVGINVVLCGIIRSNVRGEYNNHLHCPHETGFLDQISMTFEEKAKKNQKYLVFLFTK